MAVLQGMLGGSKIQGQGTAHKRKKSLSEWAKFQTVSWRVDSQKDYDEHGSLMEKEESFLLKARHELGTWLIPGLVGALTATSGSIIEKAVEFFGDMRFGYCPNKFGSTRAECPDNGWVNWEQGYLYFILVSTTLATVSATLTWGFAPMARGSGIPEIKTILGGFVMPEVLEANTLVVKIIGLSLSVAAGMSCGKEGPLVHIACCWSNVISKLRPRYAKNEAKRRELLSCACASGVAVAFGAPLGGVLFSLEEASTVFPNRTMIRAFFASSVAAVTLSWWNPTGSGKLTMFEAHYDSPPKLYEYLIFLLLGIAGGCIGSVFIHYNIIVSKGRAPGTRFRKYCHIVLEVLLISALTAVTSYHLLYTRVLSNVTIRALFVSCEEAASTGLNPHTYMLDLCDGADTVTSNELIQSLLIAGFLRYVQMIFTFGTGAPAGLFIPALYTGACLGKVTGILCGRLFAHFGWQVAVHSGIYAMIGAAAVLGGVCRVTISLVVIMFELTGGLQLIVPFMVACLTAKWVGDFFTLGIYDYCILVRKYPFLHEPDDALYNKTAGDLMDESIECMHPDCGKAGQLLNFLEDAKYGGYPITETGGRHSLIGYIHRDQVRDFLHKRLDEPGVSHHSRAAFVKYLPNQVPPSEDCVDLSHLVDVAVVRAVAETPAAQIHCMFRQLGIKLILIINKEQLVGIITKKSFITFMNEHHSGEAHAREGYLQQSLLHV